MQVNLTGKEREFRKNARNRQLLLISRVNALPEPLRKGSCTISSATTSRCAAPWGTLLHTLEGHTDLVRSVAFASDRKPGLRVRGEHGAVVGDGGVSRRNRRMTPRCWCLRRVSACSVIRRPVVLRWKSHPA